LEEQVQALQAQAQQGDESKKEALQATLQGFETFLAKISLRKEGNDFNTLNWVGETVYRLGSGLDSGREISDQVKGYYTKAQDAFDNLLIHKFAPDAEAETNLQIRVSMCERRLGQPKEALDRLQKILLKNERLLEAQRQAAYTYQEWATENPGYLLNAMFGGRKNPATGRNSVWGWQQMSAMVQNNPNKEVSEGIFHEARYNLALSRFQHANSLKDPEKTEKIKAALQDVAITYRLRPSMGEKFQWKEKYEKLVQEIQTALGEEPKGIAGLELSKPAPPENAGSTP
jgi:hypothetical protein